MKFDMCIVYKVTFTFLNMFVQKCYFLPRDIVAGFKFWNQNLCLLISWWPVLFVELTFSTYLVKYVVPHLEMGTKMKLVDFIIAHNINHNYLLSF